MKMYSLRLKPNQDLRLELQNFAKQNNIKAGSIISCVGALKHFRIRMAGATPDKQDIKTYQETHEIVSLSGTIEKNDCHLHIALSDKNGHCIGGHLKEGSFVDLTAEITLVEDENSIYKREFDNQTGFDELVINKRNI